MTYQAKDMRLADFFSVVWDQTHLQAFYNDEQLSSEERITVDFKKEPLDNVLAFLLRKKKLTWYYREETFVIVPRKPGDPLLGKLPEEQTLAVEGMVTDPSGRPLHRATVLVNGNGKGATTDKEGHFHLEVRNSRPLELVVSCIGYEPRQVTVKALDHPIGIQLQERISSLDEVMVIAYGTSNRRHLTGSVSKVSSLEIDQQPVADPLLALQGRIPGLNIIQKTGLPGGEVRVELRGRNSIAAGNQPLYIIDGIPFPGTALTFNNLQDVNRISPLMASNPLNMININDIESIEVLKDADATAIYGSRGANGIILITTKKPGITKGKLEAKLYTGIGQMAHGLDYMDTDQYLAMRKEAFARDGTAPHSSDYDLVRWDSTRYTDWEKLLLGGTASISDWQLAYSAGTELIQLHLSAGYRRETTIYPGTFSYQKAGGRVSFRVFPADGKTRLYFNVAYVADRNLLPYTDLSLLTSTAPNSPEIYTGDEQLNWDEGNFENPMANTRRRYKGSTTNLMGQLVLSRDITKDLELKASLGYNKMDMDEKQPNSFRYLNPAYGFGSTAGGYTYFATGNMTSWIAEPQLLYHKKLGNLEVNGLLGTTFQQDTRSQDGYLGYGFSSDAEAQLENRAAASTLALQGNYYYKYRYNAVFGRINLLYNQKYILNLTGRRDGSSRFGPGRQFANFGAIGAAWIFTKEPSVQAALPWMSFGKLRLSHGITGNDQIRDYGYLATYMPSLLYGDQRGQWPTRLYNPNYGWEQSRKTEAGLELGFMEDKLLLRLDYYHNMAGNQLVDYILSAVTGFPTIRENLDAKVKNWGWEVDVTAKLVQEKHWNWSTGINATLPRNKLVSFPGLEGSAYEQFFTIGFPLNTQKGYRFEGIDPASGLYQFTDANKDGRMDARDFISHKPTGVRAYGAWQNSLRYKNWSLNLLIQYVRQNVFNDLLVYRPPGYSNTNKPEAAWDRWTGQADQGSVQRYTQGPGPAANAYFYAQQSDWSVQDGSYLRLKNLSLTYSLPSSLLHRWKLQQGRLFLQGQNLLTVTGYGGRDPESASDINVYPPLRVWTFGLQLAL